MGSTEHESPGSSESPPTLSGNVGSLTTEYSHSAHVDHHTNEGASASASPELLISVEQVEVASVRVPADSGPEVPGGRVMVALVLASKTERAVLLPCDSGQYTTSGECCLECPPGEGVVKKCGATQTVCAQCLDSETFSVNYSHTEQCKPCTECTGLMRMETPCTDSNDAICVCNYNYFFSVVTSRCEPCTVCPAGQGVFAHCEHNHDTVCEECVDDTFSDRDSSLDPCLPCTICDEDMETLIAECTPTSDSVCHSAPFSQFVSQTDPLLPTYFTPTSDMGLSPPSFTNYFLPEGSDGLVPGGETTTSSAGSPRFLGNGLDGKTSSPSPAPSWPPCWWPSWPTSFLRVTRLIQQGASTVLCGAWMCNTREPSLGRGALLTHRDDLTYLRGSEAARRAKKGALTSSVTRRTEMLVKQTIT
ncbi:hypothetical protein L3Q82_002665 [Scortum barcoo]|uniref:Uncharacterized protein n=1 Tax=Scortum barcoo TaxID=214431 RepID=A0ACB8VVA3_9TELE|nr:hypothetical protein L3Q82_002665 [Scortum barcoo]